jgi:surface antigen
MSSKPIIFTGALIALTLVPGGTASALQPQSPVSFLNDKQFTLNVLFPQPQQPAVLDVADKPKPAPEKPAEKPPEPVKYSVVSGDNLTKIAAEHDTTWLRLWYKNTELTNPDLIFPGQVFLIPDKNEQLKERPVPAAVVESLSAAAVTGPVSMARGSVAGNTYDPGYCTWYVKNRRPDLPNNLGNANTWYSRAAAMGLPHGSTPRAGAVGTTTAGDLGHVVYVESVSGGTVTISEMNYNGLYSQRTRTAPASEFLYIY